jgi:hypothetical protein
MPSGFQQDSNQLSPGFYRVTITMDGNDSNSTAWAAYGDGELSQQGRVNPFNWDNYGVDSDGTPNTSKFPSSDNNGRALAAGNLRWQAIIDELGKVGDCQILDVEVNSDDSTDANYDIKSIAFTVKYDRDEGVFPAYNAIQKYEYEHGGHQYNGSYGTTGDTVTIEGAVYNTYWTPSDDETAINSTERAIQDLVWRGVVRGWYQGNNPDYTHTKSTRVYKESNGEGVQEYIAVNLPGSDNDWKYWECISVSNLDGTETTLVKQD